MTMARGRHIIVTPTIALQGCHDASFILRTI